MNNNCLFVPLQFQWHWSITKTQTQSHPSRLDSITIFYLTISRSYQSFWLNYFVWRLQIPVTLNRLLSWWCSKVVSDVLWVINGRRNCGMVVRSVACRNRVPRIRFQLIQNLIFSSLRKFKGAELIILNSDMDPIPENFFSGRILLLFMAQWHWSVSLSR